VGERGIFYRGIFKMSERGNQGQDRRKTFKKELKKKRPRKRILNREKKRVMESKTAGG